MSIFENIEQAQLYNDLFDMWKITRYQEREQLHKRERANLFQAF